MPIYRTKDEGIEEPEQVAKTLTFDEPEEVQYRPQCYCVGALILTQIIDHKYVPRTFSRRSRRQCCMHAKMPRIWCVRRVWSARLIYENPRYKTPSVLVSAL